MKQWMTNCHTQNDAGFLANRLHIVGLGFMFDIQTPNKFSFEDLIMVSNAENYCYKPQVITIDFNFKQNSSNFF